MLQRILILTRIPIQTKIGNQIGRPIHSKNLRLYHSKIIDHYENPRNVGSLNKTELSVGTGLVGAPACGDVMKLQIKVKDNIIVDAKFKTFGCGSAIASSSYGTEYIKGKSLEDIKTFSNKDIARHLKLPPVKLHCSMLMEDAVKAAVDDYKNKNKIKINSWGNHTINME